MNRAERTLFGGLMAVGVALLVVIALLVAVWVKTNAARERIRTDEQRTCRIQARGLPAGHELAASMKEIHLLLTVPPSPDAPPAPPNVKRIVASLNGHLSRYLAAEARQPAQRNC